MMFYVSYIAFILLDNGWLTLLASNDLGSDIRMVQADAKGLRLYRSVSDYIVLIESFICFVVVAYQLRRLKRKEDSEFALMIGLSLTVFCLLLNWILGTEVFEYRNFWIDSSIVLAPVVITFVVKRLSRININQIVLWGSSNIEVSGGG